MSFQRYMEKESASRFTNALPLVTALGTLGIGYKIADNSDRMSDSMDNAFKKIDNMSKSSFGVLKNSSEKLNKTLSGIDNAFSSNNMRNLSNTLEGSSAIVDKYKNAPSFGQMLNKGKDFISKNKAPLGIAAGAGLSLPLLMQFFQKNPSKMGMLFAALAGGGGAYAASKYAGIGQPSNRQRSNDRPHFQQAPPVRQSKLFL